MDLSADAFYDAWAPEYDLIFADWWEFASASGRDVATRLAGLGVSPPMRVLDCTCGIGTQAIPLAEAGYRVTGTDISERSIDRARREAASRGVVAEFDVVDVRTRVRPALVPSSRWTIFRLRRPTPIFNRSMSASRLNSFSICSVPS